MANYVPSNVSDEGLMISTAVAIDRDKNSQHAVKWAVDNLKLNDNRIILLHVSTSQLNQDITSEVRSPTESEMQKLFLPYRGFCARKGIRTKEVVLHDLDIANAICEYIQAMSLTTIVLGASNRGAIARAFGYTVDVPSSVVSSAPDFCAVYVASKGKASKTKSPKASVPTITQNSAVSMDNKPFPKVQRLRSKRTSPPEPWDESKNSSFTSVLDRPYNSSASSQDSVSTNEFANMPCVTKNQNQPESKVISLGSLAFGCNSTSSYDSDSEYRNMILRNKITDGKYFAIPQYMNTYNIQTGSASGSSVNSREQSFQSDVSFEPLDHSQFSYTSRSSTSSQPAELEDELRKLKLQLKQITEMYSEACREAVNAREEVKDIAEWKSQEGSKLEEALHAQKTAMAIVERERQKYNAAVEVAQTAQRIAELETEKRKRAEKKYKHAAVEKKMAVDALARCGVQYRTYSIEEIELVTQYFSESNKIGEGGYGPVYKAILDHTDVAIKVLKPDISQGKIQFQKEVDILSRMRHPHMVILLGACPEYGCLVYEHMENGSLEDRLFCKDGTPPLPWGVRFRIAAEIGTALNFLHNTKPEPLVHRDIKPGNILLDKNFVSKVSDVGLARLVPQIANSVTQYHMTAAVGTFCYIDPEYQQTGMLGTKSDVYSFGVLLLQIITAKPPMGLTHYVQTAIDSGRFAEVLDDKINDWPVEETLRYAELALKCCELRRKDRPDLDSVILPELERLRDLDEQNRLEGRYYYMCGQSSYQESSLASLESGNSSSTYANDSSTLSTLASM